MMITRIKLLLLFLSQAIASPRFNLSHLIYPKISEDFHPQPPLFLKDVLKAISDSEEWNLEDVRVSKLEIEKIKYGNLQRYEIEFLLPSKKDFMFSLWDEVSLWKRFKDKEAGEFEILANQVSSKAVLDPIRMQGPFELLVSGNDKMSLVLPWNTSYAGLKRILVGEDITLEVKNAHSVSLFQTSDLGQENLISDKEQWFLPCSTCMSLLPVSLSGSASIVAFGTQNPSSYFTSAFVSHDSIELLPEKCYSRYTHEKQKCPIESLRSRIKVLEKLMKKLLIKGHASASRAKLKAKIEASTAFRFQLELERNIRTNDTRWTTMEQWRTRPTIEHLWFEVLARIERKRLKPLVVKEIKPFVGVDSSAWSNFMANMSFTKLSSLLVAPEALTLNVNW